jgi:phosphoserine phosphatase
MLQLVPIPNELSEKGRPPATARNSNDNGLRNPQNHNKGVQGVKRTSPLEILDNPEPDSVLITNFEETLGEFEGDYQNGWESIHEIYGVPDWQLYEKYMDENGDLRHAEHAEEDTLLIQRATGRDAVRLGRRVEGSEQDIENKWFTEDMVMEARSEYKKPEGVTDEEYFESHVEELADDFNLYEGASRIFDKAREQDIGAMVLSALPERITTRITQEEEIDAPVYPWKAVEFDQKGSFQRIDVSHGEGKHQIVNEFLSSGSNVFYVGDGSNDVEAMQMSTGGVFLGEDSNLPTRTHQATSVCLREDDRPDGETYEEVAEIIEEFLLDKVRRR